MEDGTTIKEIKMNDYEIREFAFCNKENEANYLITISAPIKKEEAKMQLGEVENFKEASLAADTEIQNSKKYYDFSLDMSPSGEFASFCILYDKNIYTYSINNGAGKSKFELGKKIETTEKLKAIK